MTGSRLTRLGTTLLILALGTVLGARWVAAAPPAKVDLRARPKAPSPPAATEGTACVACHATSAWSDVRFPHDRTGFVLKDAHQSLSCKQCHPRNFKDRVPDQCAGCHHDVHAMEFGRRCEGCHDERTWKTSFTVDAHRSTNFPLLGRHALIPCSECHPQARERSFSRAAMTCVQCHQADYSRTAMASIDHTTAGFSTNCRQCHSTIRWTPASLPQHDECFRISSGPHGGIRCASCHSSVPRVSSTWSCLSGTAACTSCHEHPCSRTDRRHTGVPGYQCKDRKCYECHRFNSK